MELSLSNRGRLTLLPFGDSSAGDDGPVAIRFKAAAKDIFGLLVIWLKCDDDRKIVISYRGRKTMSFFGTSPRAQPEGECLKNHRFECEVRSLLFAAESKKQGQKGPFLTSPDASKNTVFETPWQKVKQNTQTQSSCHHDNMARVVIYWYPLNETRTSIVSF